MTTHRMSHTPEHNAWLEMRRRCEDPKRRMYPKYGGRGIKVCERWQAFEAFYADMGPRPSARHSLDRIDNDGNYEPGNCRWATRREQNLNYSRNIVVTAFGVTAPLGHFLPSRNGKKTPEYARAIKRIQKYGWDAEKAITAPPCPGRAGWQ
jgi:hypothetical protein